MDEKFEELQRILKFFEAFEKEPDTKRLMGILERGRVLNLSRLCAEAEFTDADYDRLGQLAFKSFWAGSLEVDTASPLGVVIESFYAGGRYERKKIAKEIREYWPLLPEASVGNTDVEYHVISMPWDTHGLLGLRTMDVGLAVKLLAKRGFVPAGLRALIACHKADPAVGEPWPGFDFPIRIGDSSGGSLIAAGDGFVGKFPMILIGAQMAKSFGRVPGNILTTCTGEFTMTVETDYLLMKEVARSDASA